MAARAGIIFTNGQKILIGHAPNKKFEPNTWDLPKGHSDEGEDPKTTAVREMFEETGVIVNKAHLRTFVENVRYGKDTMSIYIVKVKTLPDTSTYKCRTFFDWYGKKLPEVSSYRYVDISELKNFLYKGLGSLIDVSKLKAEIDALDDYQDNLIKYQI